MFLGFYRINYDIRHWLLIQNQLENDFNLIPTKNRAQILNDALELAAFDYLDYNIALNLTKYLWSENEYLPWASCIQSFQDIKLILANTHYHELFKVIRQQKIVLVSLSELLRLFDMFVLLLLFVNYS